MLVRRLIDDFENRAVERWDLRAVARCVPPYDLHGMHHAPVHLHLYYASSHDLTDYDDRESVTLNLNFAMISL